jgi:hypothetical protein
MRKTSPFIMHVSLRPAVLLIALMAGASQWPVDAIAVERAPAAASVARQRIIVLSDIEADPDDSQSLVRLLLYANEIDIEALIATTSVHMQTQLHPESIERIIEAYGKVQANLARHAQGYPAAAKLAALVARGQEGYGMAAVGDGKDSEGSRRIVEALRRPDPRPLWVTVWGGANTLAQALYRIRQDEQPDEVRRLLAKLRVYTISDQDDSGAWIRRTFPEVFYIVSPGGYGGATWTAIHTRVDGIDNSTISNDWLRQNIQQGQGPLGAAYPDVSYGMEGDTPSFLGLIPNGLNVPEHPDWGGWGGRYELYTPPPAALDTLGFTGGVPIENESRPIWTNAIDTFAPQIAREIGRAVTPLDRTYKDFRVTLWRWRDDFQNDFAARMRWTTQPFNKANHAPLPQLAHPEQVNVRSGQGFTLSALGTTDPDGDSLSYLWFHYPEAGSWHEPITSLQSPNIYFANYKAPVVSDVKSAHFILKVTDKGSPPLTRYRRVIVTITP